MPKALVPVIATLVLCGAATVAMLATDAHAQPEPKKPMLLAQAAPAGNERRPAREFRTFMPGPGQMAAHMKQMCEDGYAREVGAMAYIDARLELTAAQKPVFERWKQVKLGTAKRRAESCAAMERPRASERPSVVDRLAKREEMLKSELADVSAERPALEAFYKSLTPEQQREFTRAAQQRMMERGRMMAHRMMGPGQVDAMMHRGPMTMPMPPEGPANPPPPPR